MTCDAPRAPNSNFGERARVSNAIRAVEPSRTMPRNGARVIHPAGDARPRVKYQSIDDVTIRKPSKPAFGAWTNAKSRRVQPPAPSSARFRSDHLDEIHAFIAAYDGNHRRAVLGPGPLGYSVRTARCGEVDLGWGHTRTRQQIRGVPQGAILHVPLGRRHVYALGGRTLEARPDTAVLLAPGQEYTLYFEPDDCLVVLRTAGFRARRRTRRPRPGHAASRASARARSRWQAVAWARSPPSTGCWSTPRSRRPGMLPRPAPGSWRRDFAAGWQTRSWGPALHRRRRRWAIQRIRMVEAWIDAHLADPITLGRLCAVAGVGDRYLESAFRAHRGQTPLQFVMARRLAWVRRSLLESRPGDSVTQLAHDAGFVHLGRFAARYRSAYRESPSATLRRSLSRS